MGVTNLSQVLRSLAAQQKKAEQLALERTVAVASDILEGVVEGTPVQSGLTKANWQVGLNQAPSGILDSSDPSGDATISKGKATIEAAKPGEQIHIVNNTPWVNKLNAGSAKQKPAGWVERSIDAAVKKKR